MNNPRTKMPKIKVTPKRFLGMTNIEQEAALRQMDVIDRAILKKELEIYERYNATIAQVSRMLENVPDEAAQYSLEFLESAKARIFPEG